MNKKHLIIGGVIILILGFFAARSYQTIAKQNAKYQTEEKESEIKFEKDKESTTSASQKLDTDNLIIGEQSKFSGQKTFTYSSDFYDIEYIDGSVITKREMTYHTFDFNKNIVTQNSILNGKRLDFTFPFNGMYEEKGILATTYVLTVNTLGLKEIWWSPDVPNLGYDYDDGTRIACYDLKIKTK